MTVEHLQRLDPGSNVCDDLRVGDHFDIGGIEVTDVHVVAFAGVSGAHFVVHGQDMLTQAPGLSGCVAHGPFGLAMADGLGNRPPVKILGIASPGSDRAFRGAILSDDRNKARVTAKAPCTTKREARGIATLFFDMTNQRGETVQDGETPLHTSRNVESANA